MSLIGTRLSGRYEIVDELGRGGMANVYRANDPMLNREVAIKLIPPSLLSPEADARFLAEAQVVAQLDHPAIVKIFDIGAHDGARYFVMPIIAGVPLGRLVREGNLRLREILEVGITAATALDYSHQRGVVHRDVKPDNIMIERRDDGTLGVVLMDFGLARARGDGGGVTRSGVLVGTMTYISPEQVSGQPASALSDIYALGNVLYECVVGEPPFRGELQSVLYRIACRPPLTPAEAGAEVDPELQRLIMRCLEKDPADRPQRAKELATALALYRDGRHEGDEMDAIVQHTVTDVHTPLPRVLDPLVGRTTEMAILRERLDLAFAAGCRLTLLGGPAGIGKTRLCEELESIARDRSMRVLHGRMAERDGPFPYQCLCDVITEALQSRRTSSHSLPDLSDLAPELIALFPMLGELPELRGSQRTSSTLSPASSARSPGTQTAVLELLARAVSRIVGTRPTLIVMEDVHRGAAAIEALEYLVRRLGSAKLMILGNFRSDDLSRGSPLMRLIDAFRGDDRVLKVSLAPLDAEATGDLVRVATGGGGVDPAVARRLFEATEGNPFFIKELVRSLVQAGRLAPDRDGTWVLTDEDALDLDALPATIQQVVEARLEYLDPDCRAVLAVAAILGRSFEFDDLEALAPGAGDPDVLESHLEQLVTDGLLAEERRSRGDRLRFTSAMVRDVLVSTLSRRKRRSLHRRFAERLEARNTGKIPRVLAELVHHYSAGDVPDKTVRFALEHARRSLESFSSDDAVASIRTALEFLDDEWDGEPDVVGEAHELLARGYEMRGNVPAAMREMEFAVDVFRAGADRHRLARSTASAAHMAWQARRPEPTRRWVLEGLEVARDVGAGDVERDLLGLAITLANLRGDYDEAKRHRATLDRFTSPPQREGMVLPVGGKLVVPISNVVTATDPSTAVFNDEFEVLLNAFETLLCTDGEGHIVPGLCDHWSAEDNGRVFRMRLRPDIVAHDSTRVDANAVRNAIERVIKLGPPMPPAFVPIAGVAQFCAGETQHVDGIVLIDDLEFEFRLAHPVPIFPAMLTDGRAAIGIESTAADPPVPLAGTGPFAITEFGPNRILLERAPDCGRRSPNVDALEFRHGLGPHAVVEGFEAGEFSLASELRSADLERLLGDRKVQSRLSERPSKSVFYVAFNSTRGPLTDPRLRRALCDVINVRDVVWKTLGRFAEPASTFLPPGILGHDASRRPRSCTREEARARIIAAGFGDGLVLGALLHPQLLRRYGPLAKEIIGEWSAIGVEVQDATPDPEEYLVKYPDDCDLVVGRYSADYDDPDAFLRVAFDEGGYLSNLVSDDELEVLMRRGRFELDPAKRAEAYRDWDRRLTEHGHVLPLFHGVDYRIAGPRVRGLRLTGTSPVVDYCEVAIAEAGTAPAIAGTRATVLRVPMTGTLESLDPTGMNSVEQAEVLPAVFETLTRDSGAGHLEPWLVDRFAPDDRRLRYSFVLRRDVRFHDGRRLTARDVRYSLERMLAGGSGVRSAFASMEGAQEFIQGRASGLAGFRIESPHEFSIQLVRPIAFLPGLLAYPGLAIVPEGTDVFEGAWGSGAVGTGPFRIVEFDPGRRLELERNPSYWRADRPRCDRLVFHFNVPPRQILSDFRAGRFAIASDLFEPDVAELRRSPEYSAGYREIPRLSTTFLGLDPRRPALRDIATRQKIQQALAGMSERALSGAGSPARGLIPPGLLGQAPILRTLAPPDGPLPRVPRSDLIPLTVALNPVFPNRYPVYLAELTRRLRGVGFRVVPKTETLREYLDAPGSVDMVLGRWAADYADADAFARLIHTDGHTLAGFGTGLELDEMIDDACTEPDPERRSRLYERFERSLREHAVVIPLFHEHLYRFARPEVQGLAVSYSAPTVRFEELSRA